MIDLSSKVEKFDVVSVVRVSLLQLLTVQPVLHDLPMGAFASIQRSLSLFTAFLLNLPSVIAVEVNHASGKEAIFLVDNVSEFNVRMGCLCVFDCVTTVIGTADAAAT